MCGYTNKILYMKLGKIVAVAAVAATLTAGAAQAYGWGSTTYKTYGNTTYGSDGSNYKTYGNTTYGSYGYGTSYGTGSSYGYGGSVTCRTYGITTYCN